MEINAENKEWATRMLFKLGSLRGFPTEPLALGAAAEAFLEIVSNDEVDHLKLGKVRPAEWIIKTLLATQEWFPPPVVIRQVYSQFFRPATELPVLNIDTWHQ